jgi:hypothetical protein
MFLPYFDFAAINFFQPHQQTSTTQLDLDYEAPSEMDIVVSMYKESPQEVRSLYTTLLEMDLVAARNPRLLIYLKDATADVATVKSQTGAHNVTILPNVGREGETYLHHIIDHWDELAAHTIFVQADVHNPREFYPRVRDYFRPNTGMLSLGFVGNVCSDCNECIDRYGWAEERQILADVYRDINRSHDHTTTTPSTAKVATATTTKTEEGHGDADDDTGDKNSECPPLLLSYKGQFVVSGRRIRGVPLSLYSDLRNDLVDPKSWAHAPEYLHGRPDSMNSPFFGYTLERLWSTLFQCSDLGVGWRCPTLLSGRRRGGNPGDCQCFDEL